MQPNTCQPNTFTPLLRSRRLGTTMGLTGILSAIMARALGGSTMFRAGVSRAVRGGKSIHDFKRMAHSHPRRARLYAPSGERLKPTTEQTNAPCSCQPVPAFQVTLAHQFGARPQMRRRPMGLSALLPLAHHGHGLNSRRRREAEVQLDASCALWADGSWRPTAPKSPATAAMALTRTP